MNGSLSSYKDDDTFLFETAFWFEENTVFGEQTGATGYNEEELFFTGKQLEGEIGLYYFRNRMFLYRRGHGWPNKRRCNARWLHPRWVRVGGNTMMQQTPTNDASTGKFITEDPIKDGLNWFVYCDGQGCPSVDDRMDARESTGNNPLTFVDPSGLEGEEAKQT